MVLVLNYFKTGIVHFRREKGISAQTEVKIAHFRRESGKYAKCVAGIVHFKKGKKDFCKIDINKKDALEWEIGTEAKEISCFIKFYLTESL